MQGTRETITAVFAETAKGNGRPFVDSMADDVEWRIIGATSWSGLYRGKQQVLRNLLGPLSARLGGSNVCVPTRIMVDGDFAVVQARGENRTADGKDNRNDYCFVIRMENGRMKTIEEYSDTTLISVLGEGPHPAA
jgi:ketosteroid isomerase-like protein